MAGNEKKIICPSCDTENPADAERCSKTDCALPFVIGEKGISLSDLFKIMDARDKRTKPETKKPGFRLFGG